MFHGPENIRLAGFSQPQKGAATGFRAAIRRRRDPASRDDDLLKTRKSLELAPLILRISSADSSNWGRLRKKAAGKARETRGARRTLPYAATTRGEAQLEHPAFLRSRQS
jgi:hypothetical protein